MGLRESQGCPEEVTFIIFLKRFYLFIHEKQKECEREAERERERSRLHAGSPMWDSIPGLQDQALGPKAEPPRLSGGDI